MSDLQKHLISPESSKILATEYENSNYNTINSKRPPGKPDSKEYTYDLQVLKEYLLMVEAELERRGIRNKGIRINMGKYPNDYESPNFRKEYRGYQTIFFSPVDLDNDTSSLPDDNGINNRGEDDIPNMNYGQICPP